MSDMTIKHKLKKKYRILWDTISKEIIEDVIDETGRSVTECWREGIESFESDNRLEVDNKIKTKGLKEKNNVIRSNDS